MTEEQHMKVRKLHEQQDIKPTMKQSSADAGIADLETQPGISSLPKEGAERLPPAPAQEPRMQQRKLEQQQEVGRPRPRLRHAALRVLQAADQHPGHGAHRSHEAAVADDGREQRGGTAQDRRVRHGRRTNPML